MRKQLYKVISLICVCCMAAMLLARTDISAAENTGDFTVKGGKYGEDYKYSNHILSVLTDTPITVSGSTKSDMIRVSGGIEANITLDGVNIQVGGNNCAFQITDADVTMKLKGNNILKSGIRSPGLQVDTNGTLTVEGGKKDTLTATGGSQAAGIGGNGNKSGFGSITVMGGNITARGGTKAAGIGSGYEGKGGGSLTVKGGLVKAIGGSGAADVGAAAEEKDKSTTLVDGNAILMAGVISGELTVEKGMVLEKTKAQVQGVVELPRDVTIASGEDLIIAEDAVVTIPSGSVLKNKGKISVYGVLDIKGSLENDGEIVDYTGLLEGDTNISGNEPVVQDLSQIDITKGDIVFSKNGYEQDGISFTVAEEQQDAYVISGDGKKTQNSITIGKGLSIGITLNRVLIDRSTASGAKDGLILESGAEVELSLKGDNHIVGDGSGGGIKLENGATLNTAGAGKLYLDKCLGEGSLVLHGGETSKEDEEAGGEAESKAADSSDEDNAEDDAGEAIPEEDGEAAASGSKNENSNQADDADQVAVGDISLGNDDTITKQLVELSDIKKYDLMRVAVKTVNKAMTLSIEQDALQALVNMKTGLIIKGDYLSINLDSDALSSLKNAVSGTVTVKVTPFSLTDNRFENARLAIGTRPVYDIQVYDNQNGVQTAKNVEFTNGKVSVLIPYTKAAAEDTSKLKIAYVGADNTVEWVSGAYYDGSKKGLVSYVKHFSVYGVGYQEETKKTSSPGGFIF